MNLKNNCIDKIDLSLIELAEFIVKNFANKPHFSTQTLRQKLIEQYNLPPSKYAIHIKLTMIKKNKERTLDSKNLRVPLDMLREYKTISLLSKTKDKNNMTANRIFKVNCEGLDIHPETSFDKEIMECITAR